MTQDPISAYRAELRGAAVRRAGRYRQRRRLTVALAISFGAFLVAGGAIAAQRTWFDDPGTGQIRIRYTQDRVVGLSEALKTCLAAHGVRPAIANDGGAVFRNASAALSRCGAFATSMNLTCAPPPPASSSQDDACIVEAQWMPGLTEGKSP